MRQNTSLLLNFTKPEREKWTAEAENLSMSLSAWIRLSCNAAVRDRKEHAARNGKKRKAKK